MLQFKFGFSLIDLLTEDNKFLSNKKNILLS